jgi:hypothetical protein
MAYVRFEDGTAAKVDLSYLRDYGAPASAWLAVGGRRRRSPSQLGEQGLWGEDPHTAIRPEREHVLMVPRNENVDSRLHCTCEDQVVVRIPGDGLGWLRRSRDRLHCQAGEERLDFSPSLRLETELRDEDPHQLVHNGLLENQL